MKFLIEVEGEVQLLEFIVTTDYNWFLLYHYSGRIIPLNMLVNDVPLLANSICKQNKYKFLGFIDASPTN